MGARTGKTKAAAGKTQDVKALPGLRDEHANRRTREEKNGEVAERSREEQKREDAAKKIREEAREATGIDRCSPWGGTAYHQRGKGWPKRETQNEEEVEKP